MKVSNSIATPLTIGAFLLSAVTGVLMFFHWDVALNKVVHEWLSWLLLLGVGLHLSVHFRSFKRYFSQRWGRILIGSCVVILGLSFVPFTSGNSAGGPPFMAPMKALAQLPLTELASVAGTDVETLVEKYAPLGAATTDSTVASLVGDDLHRQMDAISLAFKSNQTRP